MDKLYKRYIEDFRGDIEEVTEDIRRTYKTVDREQEIVGVEIEVHSTATTSDILERYLEEVTTPRLLHHQDYLNYIDNVLIEVNRYLLEIEQKGEKDYHEIELRVYDKLDTGREIRYVKTTYLIGEVKIPLKLEQNILYTYGYRKGEKTDLLLV